jgi:D-serine deaminase-like pyridoxal phosphate-dependent protein
VAATGLGPVADLTTPALLLDLDQLDENISSMAAWAAGSVSLRPHAKAHKCVEIARRQREAGALGVTTATVWEALAMARADVGEVLLSSQTVVPEKLAVLAEAARIGPVLVALDSPVAADRLSEALGAAGSSVGVLVEIDVGMGRGGARSIEAAAELAMHVAGTDSLELRGVMGYEGHAVLERDPQVRSDLAVAAASALAVAAAALHELGFAIEIVSAGGTNTYDATGLHPDITEIQAGTYALMDTAYHPYAPRFSPALSVLGTVVARHDRRIILDCGTKVLGTLDFAAPSPADPDVRLQEIHEEHCLLDVVDGAGPALGDRVELVAAYCGGTANLNDRYHVVQDGVVVDVWPIVARGPGGRPSSDLVD